MRPPQLALRLLGALAERRLERSHRRAARARRRLWRRPASAVTPPA